MEISGKAYITMDVGGTSLKSAVLDPGGNVLKDSLFTIESHSGGSRNEILKVFEDTIGHGLTVMDRHERENGGIGIAIPGPFDCRKGISLMEHKFRAIYRYPLREALCRIPGISAGTPIRFVHDANAVLDGEAWKGNAEGFDNAAVVTLGTGLGFAFSRKGIVQCNELGGPAVSIFRIPYREGILEDYVAKRGFLKIYQELSGRKEMKGFEVSDIGRLAGEGDPAALVTFREVGTILSESLRELLGKYHIQCLLFGGQISRSYRYMEASLKQGLRDVKSLEKIDPVENIEQAPFLGALQNIIGEEP